MFHSRALLAVVIGVAITGIGAAFTWHNFESKEGKKAEPVRQSPETASVKNLNPNGSELVVRAFTIASAGNHLKESTFTGTLQPRYNSAIGFRIAGKIIQRNVELGQRIQKGDVLFRLDPEDLELQLRVAEADHESAKSLRIQAVAEEHRQVKLRESGSSSQSDYDLAIANLAVASSRLESSERRLKLAENQRSYCDLVADSDGLVLAIAAETGQVVNIGQTVVQVMQNDELEAVVNLPEGFESELRSFDAKVKFWSRENMELRAQLREISPVADPASRTYDAKFRLLDAADDLTIGMTATVVLTELSSGGIEVPLTSVAKLDDDAIVWRILEDFRVEPVAVELLQYKSDWAVIRGPLTTGDRIVSAGVQRIDENVTVRVWQDN